MAKRICSVEGCDRSSLARGWCKMHYERWQRRGGDPAFRVRQPSPIDGKCTEDDCDRSYYAKGWCKLHYLRWRTGKPFSDYKRNADDDEARFWDKVERSEGCWLWTAVVTGQGYGNFWAKRQDEHVWVSAHRFAYELMVGPIPEGLQIDHLCRIRACVNPDHLEPVTAAENTRRALKGRRTERT